MAKLTSTTIYGSANVTGNLLVSQTWNQGTGLVQANGNTAITGSIVAQNIYIQGGTNGAYWSQDMANTTYWSNTNIFVANNTTLAPDGTYTGNHLAANVTSGSHSLSQLVGLYQLDGSF